MLSIIIATYNAAKTIENAIRSILNQSFNDYECVIVDGKSNDNTLNIIKSLVNSNNKFKIISEKDHGIFDAINKGVSIAKYEWIYIMGADDELTIDGLSFLMKHIDNYDIIYGNTIDKYPNGYLRFPKSKEYSLVKKNMFCSHQALIMRKSLILQLNGFNTNYRLKADFDLIQRAYFKCARFKQIQKNIAYFSMTGASSTASIFEEKERYYILKKNKAIKLPFLYILFLVLKKAIKKQILKFLIFFK